MEFSPTGKMWDGKRYCGAAAFSQEFEQHFSMMQEVQALLKQSF